MSYRSLLRLCRRVARLTEWKLSLLPVALGLRAVGPIRRSQGHTSVAIRLLEQIAVGTYTKWRELVATTAGLICRLLLRLLVILLVC